MEGEITSIKYKQTGHARILEKKKLRRAAHGYLTLKSSCPLCRHSPSCFIIKKKKKKEWVVIHSLLCHVADSQYLIQPRMNEAM